MSNNQYLPGRKFGNKGAEPGTILPQVSRWHLAGVIICTMLLMGDFLTTRIALSMAGAESSGTVSLSEGNPLMMGIVSDPFIFLLSKLTILGLVVAAAYILRNNGKMAYMPYAIIGGMYLFVVINNVNLLMTAL